MGDLSGLSSLARGYADQYKDDDKKFNLFNSISDVLDSIDSAYTDSIAVIAWIKERADKGHIREIPCCPGDICYVVDDSEGVIQSQLKVDHIEINQDGIDIWLEEDDGSSYSCYEGVAFGNILFSSYEEAQKRCQELQLKLTPKLAE
jgi:hypothetical protein